MKSVAERIHSNVRQKNLSAVLQHFKLMERFSRR